MVLEKEGLEEVLKAEEDRRRINHIEVLTDSSVAGVGENYMSNIVRTCLSITHKSGKKTRTSVIMKVLEQEECYTEIVKTHSLFSREVKMYAEVLPLMEEILQEHNIPRLWPAFLGQKGNALIFEDLKNRNYRVPDRLKRMGLTEGLMVLRSIGIYHAAVAVLEHRRLMVVSDTKANFYFSGTTEIRKFNECSLRTGANVIRTEWGPQWKDIGERLYRKSFGFQDEILRLVEVDKSRFNILCHGDLWSNNMMLKYSRAVDTAIGVRFLDFQIAHYNSHIYDVMYFIVSSLTPETRRTWLNLLLEKYHESLRDCLALYGLENLAPTLQEVHAEWERCQLVHLLYSFSIMAIVGSTAGKPLDVEMLYEGTGEPYSPDNYRGTFQKDVGEELLEWARAGIF